MIQECVSNSIEIVLKDNVNMNEDDAASTLSSLFGASSLKSLLHFRR